MHPNSLWRDLIGAYDRMDWEACDRFTTDMLLWLDKGGLPPEISGLQAFDLMAVKTICSALANWEIDCIDVEAEI